MATLKKLMILGGTRFIIPVIEIAHSLGIYVVTADYLPDNDAHHFSDDYCNVSVIDKEHVLEHAKRIGIDGIISFACDPGVVSASYVAEKLGLPFQCSYRAATILQDKGLFRNFLIDNGFNSPFARRYTNVQDALNDVLLFKWPVIVKPTDSAGSKCVTKVNSVDGLKVAILSALKGSHNKAFIIEEFIEMNGFHGSSDFFLDNGQLAFAAYADHRFDDDSNNPFVPTANVWPSRISTEKQAYLNKEIQRLSDLLGLKTGVYNVEYCIDFTGKPYIMEVSPRGGGNRIAEIQDLAYDSHIIENEIRKAVSLPMLPMETKDCDGVWCGLILHSNQLDRAVFKNIWMNHEFQEKNVKLLSLAVKSGDEVNPFAGANNSIGEIVFRVESMNDLDTILNRNEFIKIEFA